MDFFACEKEQHKMRQLTAAVRGVATALGDLEGLLRNTNGSLSTKLITNVYRHCQAKLWGVTAKFTKISSKFAEKSLTFQKELETPSSFLSTEQFSNEETLKTQTTETSMESKAREFEKMELARLTKTMDEVGLVLARLRLAPPALG